MPRRDESDEKLTVGDTNKQWLGMLLGLTKTEIIELSGVQFGWYTKSDFIETDYDYQLKWMTWCSVAN